MVKTTIRKKFWNKNEDSILLKICQEYQVNQIKWKTVALKLKQYGYQRNSKQCKNRYLNFLDNNTITNPFSSQDVRLIFDQLKIYGNKWSKLASLFPNRTGVQIKNVFYAKANKIYRQILKSTFNLKNTSSEQLSPMLQSTLLCNNNTKNCQIEIDLEIKKQYQNMIYHYLDMESIQNLKQIKFDNSEYVLTYLKTIDQQYKKQGIQTMANSYIQKQIKKNKLINLELRIKNKQNIFDFQYSPQNLIKSHIKKDTQQSYIYQSNETQQSQLMAFDEDRESLYSLISYHSYQFNVNEQI